MAGLSEDWASTNSPVNIRDFNRMRIAGNIHSTRFSRVFRRVDGVKRGANDPKTSWQGVWCTWSRCAVVKIHNFVPRQDATLDPEPFCGLRSSLNSLQPLLSVRSHKEVASLPRLVTPANVPDMASQLQGMFGTPLGFVSVKFSFLTVGSRRNGHPQI